MIGDDEMMMTSIHHGGFSRLDKKRDCRREFFLFNDLLLKAKRTSERSLQLRGKHPIPIEYRMS